MKVEERNHGKKKKKYDRSKQEKWFKEGRGNEYKRVLPYKMSLDGRATRLRRIGKFEKVCTIIWIVRVRFRDKG
jgi:hypothetical protein